MIRAILVDDEPLSLQLMEKKLHHIGGIEVVGMFSNAEEALNEFNRLDFQVAFLDIEMAGLSGLDLAELILEWNSQVHIVFVTAYRDYAIQAFELNSLDYLLKPVMKDRLEKTMTRLREKITTEQKISSVVEYAERPVIKIFCFNEFAVFAENELIKWKTGKVKELFAYLIMNHNSYVNRDVLIDVLWPEQDFKKAKIQLHTSISYLRKSLESIGLKNAITFSNKSYSLSIDHLYCDVIEFEKTMEHTQTLTTENIHEIETFTKLYVGEYMEKNDYEWAIPKAQTIKETFLHTLQQMIDYYTNTKEHLKKRQSLQLLLKHNPYSENAIQQLLLHDLEFGNRTDAIQVYHDFVALLEEDLGIEPEITTKQLYEQLQKGSRA